MASLGDFSSLLQLGFATGVGLPLFRAPVDLRTSRLARTFEADLSALKGVNNEFARRKRRQLASLRFKFISTRNRLESKQFPFLVAAILGSIINLCGLVYVSFHAQQTASEFECFLCVFFTVLYFSGIVIFLELISREELREINRELTSIREMSIKADISD